MPSQVAQNADTELRCAVQARCGGCPLMPMARELQLHAKHAKVVAALGDAKIQHVNPVWAYLGQVWGYRNRLRLRILPNGEVDFFNREKALDCAVLEPELLQAIAQVRTFAQLQPAAYRGFSYAEVRSADLDRKKGLFLAHIPTDRQLPMPVAGLAENCCSAQLGPDFVVGHAGLDPMPQQRFALTDRVWGYFPLNSFIQVNAEVNRALVAEICDGAAARSCRSFCDVFCGAGNFSLPLLAQGLSGSALEIQAAAVEALAAAARMQGLQNIDVYSGPAEMALQKLLQRGQRFELLIIDPPRAGAKSSLQLLAQLAENHLAYCSCNPLTLGRDLSVLQTLGFAVEAVRLFDMFPHTEHVESLVWLTRR